MNSTLGRYFSLFIFGFFTLACAPIALKYELDPEIPNFKNIAPNAKVVYLKVVDSRIKSEPESKSDIKYIPGPKDETLILQKKLTTLLKSNNYKIINKRLLADIAFELKINTLKLGVEKNAFKSVIKGISELQLTVNRQSKQWSKTFKATKTQEVANPVNNLDVTGVMNQMLTTQLSTAFSDSQLAEFLSQKM